MRISSRAAHRWTSSRQQIGIVGIYNNVLELPHKKYRAILKASSVNFELKSEAERDSIIDAYQVFLNSLSFPVQIDVKIREVTIEEYTSRLHAQLEEIAEPYHQLLQKYIAFFQELVASNRILTRDFYLVIPFNDKSAQRETIVERLNLRSDIVVKGLARVGIQAHRLQGNEILDIFYSFYNADLMKYQSIQLNLANQNHSIFISKRESV